MKRFTISVLFVVLLAIAWTFSGGARSSAAQTGPASGGVSGSGQDDVCALYTTTHLPPEATKGADRRARRLRRRPPAGGGLGFVKGAGIIQISGDLKSTRILPTPDEVKNANLHNAAIWTAADGTRSSRFRATTRTPSSPPRSMASS